MTSSSASAPRASRRSPGAEIRESAPRSAGARPSATAGPGSPRRARRDAAGSGGPGPLEIDGRSHAAMPVAYRAGAARLPFGMLRGYIGTDLPGKNTRIRPVTCPYTGEGIATGPAVNPDVTILHAQRADKRGNVAIDGIVG